METRDTLEFEFRNLFFLFDALAISFFASVFYPGYFNLDGLYMLSQVAGSLPFSNWHPPFIMLVWSFLFALFKTAGGVWLFQIILYVYGAHLFSVTIKNKFLSFIVYIFLIFYPPIFTNMGALWKDSWAIIFTLFCMTFSIRAMRSGSKRDIILSLISLFFASLTRTDYFIIVLPMGIGAVINKQTKKWINKNNILKIGTLTGIYILGTLMLISQLLTGLVHEKLNPWLPTMIWDIAGTHRFMNESELFPEYKCTSCDPLIFGEYEAFNKLLPDAKNQSKLWFLTTWVSKIVLHPIAYMKHRLCVTTAFLGFSPIHRPYIEPYVLETPLVQKVQKSPLNVALSKWFEPMPQGFMFRYWVYLVLTFFVAFVSFFAKTFDAAQKVVVLSVFLSLSRLLILPGTDFRYGLWIIVGTIIFLTLFADDLMSHYRSSRKRMELIQA